MVGRRVEEEGMRRRGEAEKEEGHSRAPLAALNGRRLDNKNGRKGKEEQRQLMEEREREEEVEEEG